LPIEKGSPVEIHYELRDADGQVIESSVDDGEPLGCVLGEGDLPDAVEQALIGKSAGDELVIDLAPGEAFGPYDPEGLVTVPRSELPEDAEIVPGDWITIGVVDEEDGEEEAEALVVEVSPEGLVLDLNHPLAQEPLQFRITVLKTADEQG
jgi:FKBP-type peptidyl-prolyl cis-trans isomerase 2